jgi:hypothetical protein
LRGGRDRPIAAGQPWHRHPLAAQDGDQRRDPQRGDDTREFAGHADIRTTELYFIRKEEDAEVVARRIQIRLTGSKSQ